MNGILIESERARLLATLSEAPDDILLSAVHEMKRQTIAIQDDMKEINGFVGIHPNVPAKLPLAPTPRQIPETPGVCETTPVNTQPPGMAPTKIGGTTKDLILSRLKNPGTAADVNTFLKRSKSKWADTEGLLRLLWDRGYIAYDGHTYRGLVS